MPQMFPMNWLMHFFMFLMGFFSLFILNYFIFYSNVKFKIMLKKKINLNSWKW